MNVKTDFHPRALATWIGSLPIEDHDEALRLVIKYSPDIPLWIQLPHYRAEGMIAQFLPGMPALKKDGDRIFINTDNQNFDGEVLSFFDEYINVLDDNGKLSDSRFALTDETAPGFSAFIRHIGSLDAKPVAVKGQITGPFTFATSVTDETGKAIFYHDGLKDAAVKCIALKARWQVSQLKKCNLPVLLFLDEPGLTGYGSSAFISISKEAVAACLEEVIAAIHAEGGFAGIHVCANAEWSIVLESAADIVSFDAYAFFDKFILYPEAIVNFIGKGGIIAWGIVPTGDVGAVFSETVE